MGNFGARDFCRQISGDTILVTFSVTGGTTCVPAVPADWVHIVIVDVFATPVGAFHSTSAVFSIVGLDNIGDKIQCEETFVLFHVLLSKFKKCMNSAQAKRVMILSHKALAGQPSTTHLQQENAPNLDSARMIEI